MTTAARTSAAIIAQRALAIIRLDNAQDAVTASAVLAGAGIRVMEVSMAQPDATEAIAAIVDRLGVSAFVGAGTVRTVAAATAAAAAGAQFLVSPTLDEAVALWARARDLLYLPGAATPTEVETASRWSPLVKLFPAGRFGPEYLRDLRAPFPDIALVATGGVGIDNASAFLEAGAAAVAFGSSLVNPASITNLDDLAAMSRRMLQLVTPTTAMPTTP